MKEIKKLAKQKLIQFFNDKLNEDKTFSIEMPYEDDLAASNEYIAKVQEVYPDLVILKVIASCNEDEEWGEEYTEQHIVRYEDIDIWSVTDTCMYVLRSEFIK